MENIESQKSLIPELEAQIYYLTSQEGGRHTYVLSGYSGQFYYDGSYWVAQQEFIGQDNCLPGESVNVRLTTLSPHFHVGQFYVGKTFEVREGARIVGKGTITGVLRQDFNFWDFDSFLESVPADCKPVDFQNLAKIVRMYKSELGSVRQLGNLKITSSLSNPRQILTIECDGVKNAYDGAGISFREIYQLWTEKTQWPNVLSKTRILSGGGRQFELVFAAWEAECYLTGRLVFRE